MDIRGIKIDTRTYDFDAKITKVETNLTNSKAELNTKIDNVEEDLTTKIDNVSNELSTVNDDLNTKITEVSDNLSTANTDLNTKITTVSNNLSTVNDNLTTKIEKAEEDSKVYADDQISKIDLNNLGKKTTTSVFEMDSAALQKVASTIEGKTGYYGSIYIDATSGKVASNGNNYIQVNAGAKLYIPMSSSGTLTIGTYASSGNAFSTQTSTLSLKNNKTTFDIKDDDIVILNGIKYVLVTVLISGYINYVKTEFSDNTYSLTISENSVNVINDLVANQVVKVLKELNVGFSVSELEYSLNAAKLYTTSNFEKTTGTFDELYIDATNGKWAKNNTSWPIYVLAGTKIYLPYKGDGKLELNVYTSQNNFKINGTVHPVGGYVNITEASCTDGNIEIEVLGKDYINNLKYNYTANAPLVSIKNGEIYHGGNRTDDLKNQKIPYFKTITADEYDSMTEFDDDIVYLIKD